MAASLRPDHLVFVRLGAGESDAAVDGPGPRVAA